MNDFNKEEMLDRLEAMRESLDDEHGAELDYFRDQFNKELAEHALDLGLAWLECVRKRPASGTSDFDFPPRGKF